MPDPLDRMLAREARALGLSPVTVNGSEPAAVRAFCEVVLRELAARGLLEDRPAPGCFSMPREAGN